jgi:hypothetical protein
MRIFRTTDGNDIDLEHAVKTDGKIIQANFGARNRYVPLSECSNPLGLSIFVSCASLDCPKEMFYTDIRVVNEIFEKGLHDDGFFPNRLNERSVTVYHDGERCGTVYGFSFKTNRRRDVKEEPS